MGVPRFSRFFEKCAAGGASTFIIPLRYLFLKDLAFLDALSP